MDVKIAGLFAGIGGLDMGVAEGLEEYGFAVEHAALVHRAAKGVFRQEMIIPAIFFARTRRAGGGRDGERQRRVPVAQAARQRRLPALDGATP